MTGGTGFIGARFAARARRAGYRIRHLGRHAPASGEDYRALDLGEGAVDPAGLEDCALVVHLAAYIPRDHADPAEAERCWRINAMGTLYLAQAVARAGIRRFVQTTSANAYAPWESNPDEEAALFPCSRGYYLGAKLLQEIYAAEICRDAGIALATLRLASVYGPGQKTGAVAAIGSAVSAGRPVTLVDDGRFAADFVHVDDVVTALMLVTESDATGAFNVGSGVRTTMIELADLCARLADTPATILREPPADPGDPGFPALAIHRMRALGYTPRGLAAGITDMIRAAR
ncbi:NAD-dependent epimerase/dehydratase family protein [Sphingomonas sp. EC-HK361]|uniref:NAD-dependent epimerase/dehydratase family protein n=1 Tax=Sphingomonas sp. EC-HK361 TaxID=2038397 RepID=UPI001F33664D|nr:NAD-dependent epimerase/dehydratase family protein [Sphingomonas sp. EC-HK361]